MYSRLALRCQALPGGVFTPTRLARNGTCTIDRLGRTGCNVCTVSSAAGDRRRLGPVDHEESLAALHRAVDLGVNFFDTADGYGNGKSGACSPICAGSAPSRSGYRHGIGRRPARMSPRAPREPTGFVENCLRDLETEALDLVQLHCPPWDVFYMPEVFGALDSMVQQGKVVHSGSASRRWSGHSRPWSTQGSRRCDRLQHLPPAARRAVLRRGRRRVASSCACPWPRACWPARWTRQTSFRRQRSPALRSPRRALRRGETFAGVDFELGLRAVEQLRALLPPGVGVAQFALRWILMFDRVSCVMPGASGPIRSRITWPPPTCLPCAHHHGRRPRHLDGLIGPGPPALVDGRPSRHSIGRAMPTATAGGGDRCPRGRRRSAVATVKSQALRLTGPHGRVEEHDP